MGVFRDLNHAFKLGKPSQGKPCSATCDRTSSARRQPLPWGKVVPKNNQVVTWSGQLPMMPPYWYHWFYLSSLDKPAADGRYSPRLQPNYTHELYLGVLNLDTGKRRILFHSQFQIPLPASLAVAPAEVTAIRNQTAEKIGDLFAQMVAATKGGEYLLSSQPDWWLPVLQACYRRITQQMESAMDCTAG